MSDVTGLNNHMFMTQDEAGKFKRYLLVGNRCGVHVGGKLVFVLLSVGEYRSLSERERTGVGEEEVEITESGTEARGEHGGAVRKAARRTKRDSERTGEAGGGGAIESSEGEA